MRRIFDSKRNNFKMLLETKGIGFRKDGKLWVGSAAKSNKSDDSISKSNLILVLPTNAQIIAAGLNPSDAQFGQLVTFSDILTKLGLFTKRTTTKEITITPSTVTNVKKYTDLFISYFKKFPENTDIKIPRFFIKNNETTIQFNIRTPLSYMMDFSKGSGVKDDWSDFTNEAKLSANLVSCYEYQDERLSKNVKNTHASVSNRMGLVGGKGGFSKGENYDEIHGEEFSGKDILDKARDTFKNYNLDNDDEKVLSDEEYDDDENEEYFYESIEDDDYVLFDDDEVPQRIRRSPHEELTDDIIDDITRSSSVKNGYSTEDIRTLEEKYGEKAKKAAKYLLPIFKEAKNLGIKTPSEFKKYAGAAGPVSSIIRDKRLLKLEGCEDIYDAIFKNEYLSIDDCVKDIEKLLAAASQDRVKKNAMTVIWTHASQVLNAINDEMLDDGIDDGAKNQQKLFSRIVTPERIESMSQAWDIPKEEISNCNSILELLEVLYSKENLAKIYNSSNVDERPRTKGEVRKANKALELKHSGRRVRNAEDNKRVYDKEMVKAVDDAKIANYTAKYDALKAEQEKLGKERLELRRKQDSLDYSDSRYEEKYDDITAQIKDLNSKINRVSKSASSVLYTLNKLKGGVSHTKKQAAADKSVERHNTLSGDFESLANNFLDDFNVGNNDVEAKRRVLNQIRDKVGVKERKPDMAGLVKALEDSASNFTISFFIRSLNPKERVPSNVRKQYVDEFINTFTRELNTRPEDYGSLFSIEDIPIKDMYEYSEDPEESDFYESEEYNEPDKLDIKYRNGIEIRITYPKRGEFHTFLKKLIKTLPKAFDNWLKKTTKAIINDGNDIRVAYSKTIVEI